MSTGVVSLPHLIFNVLIVHVYYTLRPPELCKCIPLNSCLGPFLYLMAATVWISGLDLRPRCLNVLPKFRNIYNLFALVVVATVFTEKTWPRVLTICRVISYSMYKWCTEEKTFGCAKIPDLFINFPYIGIYTLEDIVSTAIFYWVIKGVFYQRKREYEHRNRLPEHPNFQD